jgi:hypothetical protein
VRSARAFLVYLAAAALPGLLAPGAARAQSLSTSLTVSGFPLAVAPTGADFLGGYAQTSAAGFEVATTSGPANQARSTTVEIRCALPCPTSGTKALSSLSWRRGDQGAWAQLTTSDVVVEQRSVTRGGLNDPWGNTLLFRFSLAWAADAPGTVSTYEIVLTLTVTAP